MAPPTKTATAMETDANSSDSVPKRISANRLAWQEYRLRVRAWKALSKLNAKRYHYGYHKWENMSKARRRQEELFFSFDVDFNRINLSDAPSALVSDNEAQIMQPTPAPTPAAGDPTSPVPSFPNNC